MLLYKQRPCWPLGEASQIGGDIMDLPEDVTADEWWEQTLRRWEATLELARQRLADADTAIQPWYMPTLSMYHHLHPTPATSSPRGVGCS